MYFFKAMIARAVLDEMPFFEILFFILIFLKLVSRVRIKKRTHFSKITLFFELIKKKKNRLDRSFNMPKLENA